MVEPFSGKAVGCNAVGQCFELSGRATFTRDSSPVYREASSPMVTVRGEVEVRDTFSAGKTIVQDEALNHLVASLLGLLAKIKV